MAIIIITTTIMIIVLHENKEWERDVGRGRG